MLRKELVLMAVVLAFAASHLKAAQISVSWDGGGDGYSWGDANNWDPNILPDNNATNTFAVTINAGAAEVQVGLGQSRTIDQLDCYGSVELQKETSNWVTLTIEDVNGLTNYDELSIRSFLEPRFAINGNITNTSGASFWPEKIRIFGKLTNYAEALTEVFELGHYISIDTIDNSGYMIVIPDASIFAQQSFSNTGHIHIASGMCGCDDGVFANDNNGVVEGCGILYAQSFIDNKGIISSTADSLCLYTHGYIVNTGTLRNSAGTTLNVVLMSSVDPNNDGTIEVNAGGSVTFTRKLANNPGAKIHLLGGTLAATTITQAADANFEGFGGITGDVFIDPNGIIKLTGPTNIVGDVNIPVNATLKMRDGTTLITGHTTCNNGTIHMIGGRVICQGGFTNSNCNILWEPGLYTNAADFNLDGTVNLYDFAEFASTWLWQTSWY